MSSIPTSPIGSVVSPTKTLNNTTHSLNNNNNSPNPLNSSLSNPLSSSITIPSSNNNNNNNNPNNNNSLSSIQYLCPDFKRRQLLFDSFSKFQHRQLGESSVSALASTSSSLLVSDQSQPLLQSEGAKGSLLYSWGAGYHGQLGLNTARKKCRLIPTLVEFHEPVQQVACGGFHSALLTDDGRVFTWGDGKNGQLGNLVRKHNMHSTPHLVDFFVNSKITISYIGCGQAHTAVISTQGKLYTFGSGKNGQLGHGIRLDERFPRKVETERALGSFIRIACGDRHTVVLNDSGKVITFGSSQHGQLGHGDGNDLLRPTEITNSALTGQKVTFIECGATTTGAITDTGKLYLWGFGESIHPKGMNNVVNSPRLVELKDNVKQVGLGQGHVVVLTTDGNVYTFGTSSFGQLGHGAASNVRNPRLILKDKEIQQISCGRYHTMCVSSYGIVYSFGCNESGQLGHGNLDNGMLPKIIETILPNVIGQVKCGQHHTLALSSIQHQGISPDVQLWKSVEDAEMKIKQQMLLKLPNGLKSKHIIEIEKERINIEKQINLQQIQEKEEKNKLAKEKMDLIVDEKNLQIQNYNNKDSNEDNNNSNNSMKDDDDVEDNQYDIIEISHHKDYSNTVVETPAAKDSGRIHQDDNNEDDNEDDDNYDGDNYEDDDLNKDNDRDEKQPDDNNNTKKSSGKNKGYGLGPHSLLYLDAAQQNGGKVSAAGQKPQWATSRNNNEKAGKDKNNVSNSNKKIPSNKLNNSLKSPSSSSSSPYMDEKESSSKISPVESPKGDLNLKNDGDVSSHRSSRLLPSINPSSTKRSSRNMMSPSSSNQLVPINSPLNNNNNNNNPNSTTNPFVSPLAPRISFIESQAKSLAKVKNFIATNPIQGSPEYTDLLLKMKKDYNKLKNQRSHLENVHLELKGLLAVTKPNQDEEIQYNKLVEKVKNLNMKLVTLNTRLIEAEENKKNYELTIIRMKEEDLQLSKQIDHLRHLVLEYERLLNRLEKMNEKVLQQKNLVNEETTQFYNEIQEFHQFADRTVGDYQSVLNASFKQSTYQENLQHSRELKYEEKKNKIIQKLKSEYDDIDKKERDVKNEYNEWNNKLEFYEKKFRKIQTATGLIQPDQIIAKYYFNDEITKDLKNEIENKKNQIILEKKKEEKLMEKLKNLKNNQIISKWKDVSILENKNTDQQLILNKHKEEAEILTQRITMAAEGIATIWKNVKTILNENKTEEEKNKEKDNTNNNNKDNSSNNKDNLFSSIPSLQLSLSGSSSLSHQLLLLQQSIDSTQNRLNSSKNQVKQLIEERKLLEEEIKKKFPEEQNDDDNNHFNQTNHNNTGTQQHSTSSSIAGNSSSSTSSNIPSDNPSLLSSLSTISSTSSSSFSNNSSNNNNNITNPSGNSKEADEDYDD